MNYLLSRLYTDDYKVLKTKINVIYFDETNEQKFQS